jgi:hypothetical protein
VQHRAIEVHLVPISEIMERWNKAHEERGHYRLVLGMPNQNDLLGELSTMRELDHKSLQRACLDFGA